jgi:hypothetical protein
MKGAFGKSPGQRIAVPFDRILTPVEARKIAARMIQAGVRPVSLPPKELAELREENR